MTVNSDQPEFERPKVGVGLLLLRGNSILLGQRRGPHGKGQYGGIGGHLEGMETFEECVLRELKEEAGDELKITNLNFLCVVNLMKYSPKHYVDIGMIAEWESGEPIVVEPTKLVSWHWYNLDNLPSPLFGCEEEYFGAYRTKRVYFPKT